MGDGEKLRKLFLDDGDGVEKLLQKDDVAVDVAQKWSLHEAASAAQKIVQHRRAEFVAGDLRFVAHAEACSGFRDAVLCSV